MAQQQSTLSFIINNAPQEQLTFAQELELGTRIQAGLRAQRMNRYLELTDAGCDDSEEQEELDVLTKEFGETEIDASEAGYRERKFLIEDGKAAKDDLVLHNVKLVVFVAKRYQGYRIEMAELVQEGMIGCMTAADKYDPTRGFKFSTCAVPWINQQIYRFVMQTKKVVRLPAHVVEGISRINKIKEEYAQEHEGAEPTDEEIAELSGGKLSVDNVKLYQKAAQPTASLNVIVGDEEDTELGDLVEDEDDLSPSAYAAQGELHDLLMKYIGDLPQVQQEIIKMRYALGDYKRDYTLEEVGQALGFTRERIRQLEADALLTIRVRAQRSKDFDGII